MSLAVDVWQDGERLARGNPLPVQPLSAGGRPFVDDPHTIIHQGRMFTVDTTTPGSDPTVGNGAALLLAIIPGEGNWPHLEVAYRLGGAGRVEVYELPVADVSGGTELQAINKKWDSPQTFNGTCWRNPTVSMDNAVYKEGCIILGTTGPGQSRTGAGGSFAAEIVVEPGFVVLLRLLNESGGAVRACFCVDMYNSVKINT